MSSHYSINYFDKKRGDPSFLKGFHVSFGAKDRLIRIGEFGLRVSSNWVNASNKTSASYVALTPSPKSLLASNSKTELKPQNQTRPLHDQKKAQTSDLILISADID